MSEIKSRGSMPPEHRRLWEQSIEGFDREQIEANFAKSVATAAEDSFSGFVRRRVRDKARPWPGIAEEAGIELQRFAQFMRGDGLLDTAEVDRLLVALGVELPTSTAQ